MNYNSKKPINAYSMAEFESVTGKSTVEFGRGKDKMKRHRKGMIAGGVAAGLGAAGIAGRYSGGFDKAKIMLDRSRGKATKIGDIRASKVGPKKRFGRDIESLKSTASKVKGYDYKGVPKRVGEYVKGAPKRAGNAINRATEVAKGAGDKLIKAAGEHKVIAGGGALAGVGLLGGAGYAAYKAMKNRKKNKR